jgi:hypothetical protein
MKNFTMKDLRDLKDLRDRRETRVGLLLFGVLGLFGCACPHRRAVSVHTVETFMPDRTDGLVCRETWKDTEGGGGFFLFADPNVQAMTAIHTNQWALGGGSAFAAGSFTILVDSNLAPAIAAGGTAMGNVIRGIKN